jgi:anti-sigma factor RsiW
MSHCEFESKLEAWHDGELEPREALLMTEHLKGCPRCAAALASIRQISALFAAMRRQEKPDAAETVRLHEAVDREMDSRSPLQQVDPAFWRAAAVLSGLAASVLIVASAWLWDLPRGHVQQGPMLASSPPWEEVAVTLRPDPLIGPSGVPNDAADQTDLAEADASAADSVLATLHARSGNEVP